MKRIAISLLAVGALAAPALAEGHIECDGDACVVNGGGKVVWTVVGSGGANNGGKGKTDKAGPALTSAPGLSVFVPE